MYFMNQTPNPIFVFETTWNEASTKRPPWHDWVFGGGLEKIDEDVHNHDRDLWDHDRDLWDQFPTNPFLRFPIRFAFKIVCKHSGHRDKQSPTLVPPT